MSLLSVKIYLDNLIHNYDILKKITANLGTVVKADGYGLGAVTVTNTLKKQGCQKFFVASASEGKILRKKFVDIDIYVFDGFIDHKIILDYGLKPVLNTVEQLQLFAQTPHHHGAMLHIDTGMNRLGIPLRDINKISKNDIKNAQIDYIMTHFVDSEKNYDFTQKQIILLGEIADFLDIKNISVANSGGILNHHFPNQNSLGRAGIALYGGINTHNLRPVVSVSGQILQKKNINKGEPVGYGSTFITQKPTRLFTVSGGYADGIMRSLSNSGFCGFVNGHKIPLVGRVSMDTCIFDATDLPDNIALDATALEFFGLNNPITKIADTAKTIPYEFLTNLSRRANRIVL